jgi:26S proteasome regulatory subunit N2
MAVDEKEGEKKKKKKEEDFEVLGNLSRIVPSQVKYVTFKEESRFVPVKKGHALGGIMILLDKTPEVAQEIIPYATPKAKVEEKQEDNEPAPPGNFH